MSNYLNRDFFLDTETARDLYHRVAKNLPIIDFHTHLSQKEILDDHRFSDIWELWLKHDHYKWRLMRACGVPESHITGSASPKEKFTAFATILPMAVGNPVHQWAHLELQRVFDIHSLLNADTAATIWDEANAQLRNDPSLSVRGLLQQFGVKRLCTTDDPANDLACHQALTDNFSTQVLPTFRPDKAMIVDQPANFCTWLESFETCIGSPVSSYKQLLAGLKKRHDEFHAVGCRLSDHGIAACPTGVASSELLEQIFQRARSGQAPEDPEHATLFAAAVLQAVAAWNHEKNWTMQLHLGPLRNVNPPMFDSIGPDSGFDTMGAWPQTGALVEFLSTLQSAGTLPRMIVYNLNPNESAAICCALQNFQDDTCPGKLQYGPAWWHLDHKQGILEQLELFASLGALGTFVGMLTDSRSFTSYVRHEYFRRLLCQFIGRAVEQGEIPDDNKALEQLIEAICYTNADTYFQWPDHA